ncbi:hypothetical protein PR048_025585 [Dryococelus australis]|uniref:Endonuclease/exonuclease/phosphatase domain-containing protein n=1 Tax=Dryococelus australis TaxID=614101 RepID=A0ABQ9GRU8_9NEOP|nr:hypothetical protein PR048_025585 [Dryococelus australis]
MATKNITYQQAKCKLSQEHVRGYLSTDNSCREAAPEAAHYAHNFPDQIGASSGSRDALTHGILKPSVALGFSTAQTFADTPQPSCKRQLTGNLEVDQPEYSLNSGESVLRLPKGLVRASQQISPTAFYYSQKGNALQMALCFHLTLFHREPQRVPTLMVQRCRLDIPNLTIPSYWRQYAGSFSVLKLTKINNSYNYYGNADPFHRGVAVMVKKALTIIPLVLHEVHPHVEMAACSIAYRGKLIDFYSVYAKPRHSVTANEWNTCLSSSMNDVIFRRDFNAHHTTCGYSMIDGLHTYMGIFDRRSSAIDLTFCSPKMVSRLQWSVKDDPLGSNHYPIVLTSDHIMTEDYSTYDVLTPLWYNIYAYHRTEWDVYQLHNAGILPKYLHSKHDVHHNYDILQSTIQDAIKRIDFDVHKREWSKPQFLKYLAAHAKFRITVRWAKKADWRQFCSFLRKDSSSPEVWQKIRSLQHHTDVFSESAIGSEQLITSHKHLASDYVPHIAESDCVLQNSSFLSRRHVGTQHLLHPITALEYAAALRNTMSAPGFEGITYRHLKQLPHQGHTMLLGIYNDILNTSLLPRPWSVLLLAPIRKPNKDCTTPMSYRHITLASCVAKTFERIIKAWLEWSFERNNLL